NVFQLKTFALIIADLGVGLGNRNFFAAPIDAQRPVQQVERAIYWIANRIETASTTDFHGGVQLAHHAYVVDVVPMAAMLDNHLGTPLRFQGSHLVYVASEVNRTRLEFLVEFQLLELQIGDPNQHRCTCLTP